MLGPCVKPINGLDHLFLKGAVELFIKIWVTSELKDESILSCLGLFNIVHTSFQTLSKTVSAAWITLCWHCLSERIFDGYDAERWLTLASVDLLQQFRIVSVGSHVVGTTISEFVCEVNQLTCVETFADPRTATWICELQLLAYVLELENCAFARADDISVFVRCRVTTLFNRLNGRIELKHLIERINSQQVIWFCLSNNRDKSRLFLTLEEFLAFLFICNRLIANWCPL